MGTDDTNRQLDELYAQAREHGAHLAFVLAEAGDDPEFEAVPISMEVIENKVCLKLGDDMAFFMYREHFATMLTEVMGTAED